MAFLSLGDVGFARQASKGTVPGTAFHWMPLSADASKFKPTWKTIHDGLSRSAHYQLLTGMQSAGDVTVYPTLPGMAYLLAQWAGGTDTVSGTVTPYTHTMALASGDIGWVTVQRNFDSYGYCYNDLSAKIESIDFAGKANAEITAKIAWQALQPRTVTKTTASFDTEAPLLTANAAVTIKQGSTAINGVCTSWDLSLKQTLSPVMASGALIPVDLTPQVRAITGKATVTAEASDVLVTNIYGLSGTANPTGTPQTGSVDILITSSNAAHSLDLKCANAYYTAAEPVIAPDGKTLEIPITWTAILTSGNDEVTLIALTGDAGAYSS